MINVIITVNIAIIITVLIVFYFIKFRKARVFNKKIKNELPEEPPSNLSSWEELIYKTSPELFERPIDHELTEKEVNDEGKLENG